MEELLIRQGAPHGLRLLRRRSAGLCRVLCTFAGRELRDPYPTTSELTIGQGFRPQDDFIEGFVREDATEQ